MVEGVSDAARSWHTNTKSQRGTKSTDQPLSWPLPFFVLFGLS